MIRELLEKRTSDYESLTGQVLELFEAKLLKALRQYIQTDRNLHIARVTLYHGNHNFVISHITTVFKLGELVKVDDNTEVVVTKENIGTLEADTLKLILPAKLLEEADADAILETMKEIDNFVENHGHKLWVKCIDSGIVDMTDLLKEDNQALLDELTDPIHDIVKQFDDLQKAQYMLFSKTMSKVVH